MRDEPNVKVKASKYSLKKIPERASIHLDSRAVATEVGIR